MACTRQFIQSLSVLIRLLSCVDVADSMVRGGYLYDPSLLTAESNLEQSNDICEIADQILLYLFLLS